MTKLFSETRKENWPQEIDASRGGYPKETEEPSPESTIFWQHYEPHILKVRALPAEGILSVGVKTELTASTGLLELHLTQPFPISELMVVRHDLETFLMPSQAFFQAFRLAPPEKISNEN